MLRVTCPVAPTQVEGRFGPNADYVYFRERGGHWTFSIGKDEDEAVNNSFKNAIVEADCPEFMSSYCALQLAHTLASIYCYPKRVLH